MGKVKYLDFQAIKLKYSIEELMDMTGLTFKKQGKSFRCECPVHGGGSRSLVVTPSEADDKGDSGVFYCFGEKVGGDRVALLAHVRDSKPYAVFKELAERKPDQPDKGERKAPKTTTVPEEKDEGGEGGRGFRPLPYLQAEHEAVQAMGFQPETAKALGIGFSPRGVHRGRLAIPIRTADGTLAGYISITADTSVQLPPKWHL